MKSSLGAALGAIKKADPAAVAAAAPVGQPASAPADETTAPVGVVFRMSPRDHQIVSDYADDLGMSMQELIETAINEKRQRQGLAPIQGRPRSRTRRRR